jgi:AraC family transcriptional regulator, regulatory protein of adaptative response / methylated-DNA-[protein]-cysteine methyltransferase
MRKRKSIIDESQQVWTPPTKSRAKRQGEVLTYGIAKSALGTILVATSAKGVVAVLIGEDAAAVSEELRTRFPKAHLLRDDQANRAKTSRLVDYIESAQEDVDFDLDLRGTKFQQKVWQAVRKVMIGQTTTYTDLARAIGFPKAIRAVANACSINPLAFAVPCHRVLHKNRALSFGHNRGNDRQRPMVEREARAKAQLAQVDVGSFENDI